MASMPVQTISRFRLVRQIGRGAQGKVFLATDPQLGRTVAVKTVTPQSSLVANAVARLLKEARTASSLSHPNLVPVYEAGLHGVCPYVVFEYVEGRTLAEVLRVDGVMPPARAVITMSQILAGVAHAHAKGLIHGDITPSNILVTSEGVPRVTDFGISRGVWELVANAPSGTPRYMAPEHFRNCPADMRSDVYALGVIFYEMLTGQPAVPNGEEVSVINRVLNESIPIPSHTHADIDPRLDEIVRRAVEKEPDARYADASDMKTALDRIRVLAVPQGSSELHTNVVHSTVEFMLLRMKRKPDFPVLSQRLSAVNQLTSDSNQASIKQLANLVLQDFALTNKLLRVSNSVACQGNGQCATVSDAIMKLGLHQVRALATSLILANPPPGRTMHPVLPEVLLGAFIAAVLGRNIGQLAGLANAEDLFICTMLSRLGEILTIYYFPEEYDEIAAIVRTRATDELRASQSVLGVGFDVLGIEVARRWKFAPNILYAMRALPEGILSEAITERERNAHCAGFARELCDAAWRTPELEHELMLSRLIGRFHATVPRASRHLRSVIAHSLDLGKRYCHALNIGTADSPLLLGLAKYGTSSEPQSTTAIFAGRENRVVPSRQATIERPLHRTDRSVPFSSTSTLLAWLKGRLGG